MGLKESGLRGSIRNVSTGIGAAISIDTLEAENVEADSATIRGEITELTNFGEDAEVFFEWGETTEGLPNTTDIQLQDTVGVFTEDLTNLSEDTTHEFQAFGSVRDVSDDGVVLTFETGAAIPDSAVHHWPINEGSGSTLVDNVGEKDGNIVGSSYISNSFFGNYALEADGIDDKVELGNFPSLFHEDATDDFAVLFTFESEDEDGWLTNYRASEGSETQRFGIGLHGAFGSGDGNMVFYLRDDTDNQLGIETDERHDDGQRRRYCLNKTGNSSGDLEIWVDGSEASTNQFESDTVSNFIITDEEFAFFAATNRGDIVDHTDAILDNVIICDSSLEESEIEADYDQQPWV